MTNDEAPANKSDPFYFNFYSHLRRQAIWSRETFGPSKRTKGIIDHIKKEFLEIEADPGDLKEWIDVVILGLDGAWRTGASPADIIAALVAKQAKNESREWPDWRGASEDVAIEHVRMKDVPQLILDQVFEMPKASSDCACGNSEEHGPHED